MGDWTLTGCVAPEGTITWTAVNILGDLYLWMDGEWHIQQQPPIPAVDLFPESNNVGRAKYGLPTLGKQDGGRILYSHALSGGLSTTVAVHGTTNSRHFPFSSLSFSCSGSHMTVTASAFARYGATKYPARLDLSEEAPVSFESAPPHRWSDSKFRNGGARVLLSVGTSSYYQKEREFFRDLVVQEHLAMQLPEVDGPIIIYFDLDGVFETPVQHLLERCLGE